jgi:hypothetical protein
MQHAGSTEKEVATFQLPAELKRKAERAAERDGRSLSAYLRRVLRIALAAEDEHYHQETHREEAVAA